MPTNLPTRRKELQVPRALVIAVVGVLVMIALLWADRHL